MVKYGRPVRGFTGAQSALMLPVTMVPTVSPITSKAVALVNRIAHRSVIASLLATTSGKSVSLNVPGAALPMSTSLQTPVRPLDRRVYHPRLQVQRPICLTQAEGRADHRLPSRVVMRQASVDLDLTRNLRLNDQPAVLNTLADHNRQLIRGKVQRVAEDQPPCAHVDGVPGAIDWYPLRITHFHGCDSGTAERHHLTGLRCRDCVLCRVVDEHSLPSLECRNAPVARKADGRKADDNLGQRNGPIDHSAHVDGTGQYQRRTPHLVTFHQA